MKFKVQSNEEKVEDLQQKIKDTQMRLDRAQRLLKQLSESKLRWIEEKEQLR
jgi:peptidoglycan hydrolase CwlO-like protein